MSSKQLEGVECIGVEKRTIPSKHHVYALLISWSDGLKCPIYRRYSSFFDFLSLLKEQVTENIQFPELPAYSKFMPGVFMREAVMDKRKKIIDDFCQHILRLPQHVISSHAVVAFFESWDSDISALSEGLRNINVQDHTGKSSPEPNSSKLSPRFMRKAQKVLGMSSEDLKGMKRRRGNTSPTHDNSSRNVSDKWVNNGHPVLNRQNGIHNEHLMKNKGGNSPPDKQRTEILTANENSGDKCLTTNRSVSEDCESHISRRESDEESETLPRYSAISSFKSRKRGELNLHEGTTVQVMEKNISGWWFVSVEGTEEQGWAPGAFLEPVNVTEEEEDEGEEEIIGWCKTISDYTAQSHDEVSFLCGEKVVVISTSMDGWWKVRNEAGSIGYTPVACFGEVEFKQPDKVSFIRNAMNGKSIYGKAPPPRRLSTLIPPTDGDVRSDDVTITNTDLKPQRKPKPKPTVEYTQVVFPDECPVNMDDDISCLYAKVNKPQKKKPIIRKESAVLYAEINPLSLGKSQREEEKKKQSPAVTSPTQNAYINCVPKNEYVNVEITREDKPKIDDDLFQVTRDYDPKTSHVQGLNVSMGDVVYVEKQSGNLSFCIQCMENGSDEPSEGWVPSNLLTRFTSPVSLTMSTFNVPIVPAELKRPLNHDSATQDPGTLAPPANEMRRFSCDPPAPPKAPSPRLQHREINIKEEPNNSVPIEAKSDFSADTPGTLNFKAGDCGLLLDTNPLGWWLVNLGGLEGWVPGDYWRKVEPKKPKRLARRRSLEDSSMNPAKHAWFFGNIDRHECEKLLYNGENRDFMVRESKNRIGDYSLSVLFEKRVRHFPVRTTESGKFFIGNHHYSSLVDVIKYYQLYTLFHTESGDPVMLGKPLPKP